MVRLTLRRSWAIRCLACAVASIAVLAEVCEETCLRLGGVAGADVCNGDEGADETSLLHLSLQRSVPRDALNKVTPAQAQIGTPASGGSWADWITKDPWLQLLNISLLSAGCYLLYTFRDSPKLAKYGLGIYSHLQAFLFLGYIIFSTMHMFLQQRAGSTKYSPVAATVLVYFGKAIVAFIMHWSKAGFDLSPLMHPSGGRFGTMPAFFCTALPGAMFAVYDTLSFVSLAGVDPVTYQIVIHCRILITAVIWQTAFRRLISRTQWFSIVLFVAASITKGADVFQAHSATGFCLFVLVGQVAFSAFNSVLSEVLLKEVPVPTDLLNCAMYLQGLIFLLVLLLVVEGPQSLGHELFLPSAWSRLCADPWMLASISCLVTFGLFTAYFLREMSCILKELTGCCVTVVSAVLEWGILSTSPCTIVGMQSVLVAIMALMVYNVDPLAARSDQDNCNKIEQTKHVAGDLSKCKSCNVDAQTEIESKA